MFRLKSLKYKALNILLAALIVLLEARPAFCLPQGATVKNGTATFSNPNENTLEINASNKAIINYQSFDVAKNETVIINLPSINNSVLNRVLGSSASQILGSVVCNGIFIIINEKGIFFGPNSNINVGSLIASTRDISDTDFMNSNYIFSRLSKDQMDALILNQGQINISDGGFGIMIAGGIENAGTIAAKVGTIALAAGEMVHVDISPAGRVSVAIDKAQAKQVLDHQGKPITDQIKNTGTLAADGGVVLFKASSVGGIFEKAINLEGYIQANSIQENKGLVSIIADGGQVRLASQTKASNIEIGNTTDKPREILIEQALLQTEENLTMLAQEKISVGSDITADTATLDADIVELLGDEPVYLTGDMVIHNLKCDVKNKTIYFGAGNTFKFMDNVYIKGERGYDGLIKLFSSSEGTPWYADFSEAQNIDISLVALKDAYNLGEVVKLKPATNWGNSFNWDTDPTWVALAAGSWSTAANWDLGVVPSANDAVVFDGLSSNQDCLIDDVTTGALPWSGGTFNMNANYEGEVTLSPTVVVAPGTVFTTGTFTLAGGTFNQDAEMVVDGNFGLGAGATSGTGVFNASAEALTVSGTFRIEEGLGGDVTFNQGTGVITVEDNFAFFGDGDPTFNKDASGLIVFAKGGAQELNPGNMDIGNIRISENPDTLVDTTLTIKYHLNADDIDIETDQSLSALDGLTSWNIECAGDWTNDGGFTFGEGTVTFNGLSNDQDISGAIEPEFYNLTITKDSGTVNLLTNTIVNNRVVISDSAGSTTFYLTGQLELGNAAQTGYLTLGENSTLGGGNIYHYICNNNVTTLVVDSTSSIETDQYEYMIYGDLSSVLITPTNYGSALIIVSETGDATCYLNSNNDLTTLNGANDTLINLEANLGCSLNLDLTGYSGSVKTGTFVLGRIPSSGANLICDPTNTQNFDIGYYAGLNYGVYIGDYGAIYSGLSNWNIEGNWDNYGFFDAAGSTITLDGGDADISTGGIGVGNNFYNLIIDATGDKSFADDTGIDNNLTLETSGTVYFSGSLEVGGDYEQNGGIFTGPGGVDLGNFLGNCTINAGTFYFPDIFNLTGNYIQTGGFSSGQFSGTQISVGGDLTLDGGELWTEFTTAISGTYTQNGGTANLSRHGAFTNSIGGDFSCLGGITNIGPGTFNVTGNSDITGGTVNIDETGTGFGSTGWTTTDLTIGAGGTVNCGGVSLINVSGNWDSIDGTFNSNNSIVDLTGTGSIATGISGPLSLPTSFYSLKVAGNNQTTTMLTSLTTTYLTVGDNTAVLTDLGNGYFIHVYNSAGDIFTDAGASLELGSILIIPQIQGSSLTIPTRDYTFTTVPGGTGLTTLQIEASSGSVADTTYTLTGDITTNNLVVNVNNTTGQTNTCILDTDPLNNYNITARGDLVLGIDGKENEHGQINANASTIAVNGSVIINRSDNFGDNTINAGSSIWNVGGSWINRDIFNAGTSTVNLTTAADAAIYGSTTFYDLNCVVPGKRLTFEASSTQTIANSLTLTGGTPIVLRSSVPGQYWYLDTTGATRNIHDVDVQDGFNLTLPIINPYSSIDSGHNVNWFYYDIWTPDPEEFDQIGSFWYEEGQRKRQRYPKGKYRTIVVVYEGKVVMTPYDETGLRTDEAVTLVGGQSSAQDGEVR